MTALLAVVACQKEASDDVVNIVYNPDGSYVYTVKASLSQTKSDYDASGNFSWSSGDAISVLFHNGETNKFFTLTTTGSGKSASFSGTIDSGFEIGASDGTVSDKKIWALFPASSNHAYTSGESYPKFYVQPSVDFSATPFSANVPMWANNTEEGAFSFANAACTFKFTVSGIKSGISKIGFTIYNQTTFGLSGLWPLYMDGSKTIINYGYASPGSANSTLSYVGNVSENKAVFYVSCHGTFGTFNPVIRITNPATGITVKTFTSTKNIVFNDMTSIQPINLDVSDGDYYTPAISIDGDMSDWSEITGGSNGSHTSFKVTSDSRYVYFYSYRASSTSRYSEIWGTHQGYIYVALDLDNDAETGGGTLNGNGPYEYVAFIYPYAGTSAEPAIATSSIPGSAEPSPYLISNVACSGCVDGEGVAVEFSIPRADLPTIPDTPIRVYSWGSKDLSKVTLSATL